MQAYLADTMTHTGHQGWTEWSAAGGTLSGGKYYLAQSNDTALATTVYINANTTVYLCLNGNTLSTDSRIYVYGNGTLHICDCSAGHTGKITSSGSYTVENRGTLYLHSGTLENTEGSYYSYAIYSSENSTVSVSGGGAVGRYGIYATGTGKVYLSGTPDISGSYQDLNMGANAKLYATASANPSSAAYTGDVLTLASGKIAFDPVVYNAGSTEKFQISGSYPLYLAENGRDLTWDKDYTPDSEMQMAYTKWDTTTFDVIGNSSSGWLLTTFNEEGYRTIAEGLTGATVVCTPKFVNGGKYVQLRYTVTAGGQDITAGKLAVHADVKIGSNDRAAIEVIRDGETVVGLKMADNAAGQFSLYFRGPGTTDADTYWFGYYNNRRDNCYNQLSEDTKSKSGSYTSDFSAYSGADSGMALSWQNIEIAAGESKTFSILVGVGDAVEAPVLTSFTPATAAEQVNYTATVTDKEGTPIELYYSIDGGDELSLGTQTVTDGQAVFTGTVDCALLSAGTHDVTFWAINDAGAMSGSKTCTVSVTDKHIHSDVAGYFREWTATDSLPTQSGSYYLKNNVSASGIITIPENVTVNLCLNGKAVNLNSYYIINNGNLTVCDCGGSGKITGNQSQSIYNKGTLNICGGTVENIRSGSASYSIHNTDTGTAAVSGGTVSGIKNEGVLYISGGTVTADADYAILNDETDAVIHVSGGSISAERYGIRNLAGTVYLSGQPTVTGATASIYKVAMDARLYAHSNDTTPVPYTGDLLTLYIPSASSGNVAVYGVTSENMDSFRITNDGFSLVLVEDDLVLHQHRWSYSLSPDDKTVTAQCNASNCDYAGTDTSITIAAPEKTVYNDGKTASATLSADSIVGKTALPAIQYVGRAGTVYAESAAAPTNAGKYTAKITVGGVTASIDYEIAKAANAAPTSPTGTDTSYIDTNDGKITGVDSTMEYRKEGQTVYTPITGTEVTGLASGIYYVRYAETANLEASGDMTVAVGKGGKYTGSITNISDVGKTYDGSPVSDPAYTYVGDGQVAIKWYADDNGQKGNALSNAPTDAGTYWVGVSAAEGSIYYAAGEAVRQFTITKASFAVEVKQNGTLIYNGTQQSAAVAATPSGVQGGMAVTYKYGLTANTCTGTTVPAFKNADTYTVYFVATAPNHNDVTGSFEVKITAKEIGIKWYAPGYLVFDGGEKVARAEATGLCQSDTLHLVVALTDGNDNVNAGSFTCYVTGIDDSNYILPANVTSPVYTITPRPVNKEEFEADTQGLVYNGQPHTPMLSSICSLVTTDDFTVAYQNNTNAGTDTAKIVITGKNNATGVVVIYFSIAKATPVTSFPTGLNIAEGKTLAEVSGVSSGYSWDAPDTVVAYGPHDYSMTYTHPDTDNYNAVTQNVSVYGNDVTAPTGTVRIGESIWDRLWSGTGFDLFFDRSQTVTVTAGDTQSGILRTEFYLASSETDDFTGAFWVEFSDSFQIDPNNAWVVYIRITDNAGNAAILNSDGVVLDNIQPVLSGIENGKTYYQSVEVTVTDTNLDRVEVNEEEAAVSEGKITLTARDDPQSVIAYDKAGNISAEVTVTVEGHHSFLWGQWYDNLDGTHSKDGHCVCGADLTVIAPKEDEVVVDGLEEESEEQGKDLQLVVEADLEKIDEITIEQIRQAIQQQGHEKAVTTAYLDISVLELQGGQVVGDLTETATVLEVPITFDFAGKLNLKVYHNHDGTVEVLAALSARAAQDRSHGTYFADTENGLLYVYLNRFSTVGISYHAHEMTHVAQKAPTEEADGNIEYWYCEGCDSYFTDAYGKNEITQPETVVKSVASPKTGDSGNQLLWSTLLLLSALSVVFLIPARKKKEN